LRSAGTVFHHSSNLRAIYLVYIKLGSTLIFHLEMKYGTSIGKRGGGLIIHRRYDIREGFQFRMTTL
jgi:hypothetical protein